ncbi:hypothetical protein [Fibrobacter succinogenes]|uniref:AbiTii domain-containing protein n=1 Tax=Fibrobacter succinogenes TaxID=833 RepID=UPI0015686652|nr:hypothetical protein [Fibrobacter succinogenes]
MKLIEDFIADSAKSQTPLPDLLEEARSVANVIGEFEFASFCEKELNGYDEDDLPDYRYVEKKVQGWYDSPLEPNAKRYMTTMSKSYEIRDPMKVVCDISKEQKDYERFFEIPNDPWKGLYKNKEIIRLISFQRIEFFVRQKINDWKNQMLKNGKLALDGSNPKMEINNININGSVNGSNIVGNMDNSSASVNKS